LPAEIDHVTTSHPEPTTPAERPDGPPKEIRFHKSVRFFTELSAVWRARSFVRALAEREVRARYKQAFLGIAWAVVNPVLLMIVFTFLFGRVVKVETNDVPYAIFSYIALVPWNFFSNSVSSSGLSIIGQMQLVNKIRCPREVFPIATITSSAFDSIIACSILLILFAIEQFAPRWTSIFAIIPLAIQLVFTLAVSLAVAAITVHLRDVRHALGILLQIGLFVTPVAYSIDAIPGNWQVPYVIANPMAAVITTYRDTILMGEFPQWHLVIPAAISSLVMLYGAVHLFGRLETSFADVA
jgi:ABC-2 type transport system permease protein/lipopolysaccharide transport system permease protein